MKPTLTTTFVLCFLASAAVCRAGKGTELKPVLAKPGKPLAEENFPDAALGKAWKVAKGDWQPRDGALVGKEKASDKHAAVLTLDKPGRDSVIRFSFKLDGAKGFNLSYNHAKGHLFRILINDDGLIINKDKDKKDAKSRAEVLGKAAGKFAPGQWHTLLVEVKGEKVSVQADNGAKAEGSHKELNVNKTGFRFVTRGESVLLDDVKVWAVE